MVPLFGVPTQAPLKNREEGGALVLGGHQSIKILNNQLIVGRSGRGGVLERRCAGGYRARGDTVQLFGVANETTKK